MKTKITLLTAVLFLSLGVFFPQQSSAQTPEKINYQAVARDLDGNPLTGETVNVQFDIIQASAVIYRETQNLTTNQFGLFTAAIGSGTVVSGVFSTIDWGSNPTSLQVTVNGDVMPSTQLLSVPYALYAKKSLNGPTGAQGPAGVGINWLGSFSLIPLNPNPNDAYYNTTDGKSYIYNGTWQILAQDGSASGDDWGNQFIITSGTNISGDGTAGNPLTVTEVDGSITNEIQQLSFSTPNLTISGVGGNTVNLSGLNTNDGNGIYSGNGSLSGNTTITGGTNSLSLTSSANNAFVVDTDVLFVNGASDVVGIGTATPTQKLDVDGKIRMRAGSGTAGWIPVSDAVGTLNWTDPTTISTASFWTQGTGTLYPTTITDNVGIGIATPNPLAKLHLADATQTIMAIQSSHGGSADEAGMISFLRSRGTIAAPTQVLSGDRLGKLEFVGWDSSNWKESAGIIGLADELFTLTGIGSHLEFRTTPIGSTSSNEVMRITNNGLVGIGIPSPTAKMHIHSTSGIGNFRLTGATTGTANTDGFSISNDGASNLFMQQHESADWYFSINGTTAMTIKSSRNVGIGTTNPTERLEVAGNVLAQDYLYTTPKTLFLTLGESDFKVARGVVGQIESSFGLGGVGIVSSSGTNALLAPIHLPNGAVVTAVKVYYVDNSVSNMTIVFQRRALTGGLFNISSATTSTSTATVQTLTLTGATINNASYSYNIRVYSTGWPSGTTKTMEIKTVKITYTIVKTD